MNSSKTFKSILPTPAQQRERSSKAAASNGSGKETEASGSRTTQSKQTSSDETCNSVVQTPSVLSTPVAATLQDSSVRSFDCLLLNSPMTQDLENGPFGLGWRLSGSEIKCLSNEAAKKRGSNIKAVAYMQRISVGG
ncbi:hypothetical protein F66182_813 [Fusarium sp. NRRL 66182]|nr:hypothetical protein F66182_813 [Fusarium sp. NRRL 66182]